MKEDGTVGKIGEQISWVNGGEHTITIYNAAESGPLSFVTSFSGSEYLAVAASVAAIVISIF